MTSKRSGKHIGTFGMSTTIITRSGLPFGISLYQKTAEIWYKPIYLIDFIFPPSAHTFVERISCRQTTHNHRRCKIHRYVSLHTIRTELIGNSFDLYKIIFSENGR